MTSVTHALIGLAIGSVIVPRAHARVDLVIGALCAVLPDVDLVAPFFGGDRDFHRGFTHSLFFAGLLGAACGLVAASRVRSFARSARLGALAALCSLSHGVFDMLTTYSMGVGMLSPFSPHRYVWSWQPVDSMTTEMLWVAFPAVLVLTGMSWLRRIRILSAAREQQISLRLR